MSGDFGLVLLAAFGAAWAVAMLLRKGAPRLVALPAVLLYALLGMEAALLIALNGDGRVLPGYQLSPGIVNWWRHALGTGMLAQPAVLTAALLLHVLAVAPRPGLRAVLAFVPSSVAFVVLFAVLSARDGAPPPEHVVALGPGRLALLTLVPLDGGRTRMIFAETEGGTKLLRVLHVHVAEGEPPSPRVEWTLDGEAVVFMTLRRRIFALPLHGPPIGLLPDRASEWPHEDPATEPVPMRAKYSQARMLVDRYIQAHGGIFVPPDWAR